MARYYLSVGDGPAGEPQTWTLLSGSGTRIPLPPCSGDWQPSAFWVSACLHDPEAPLCRAHWTFFRDRKEHSGGQ